MIDETWRDMYVAKILCSKYCLLSHQQLSCNLLAAVWMYRRHDMTWASDWQSPDLSSVCEACLKHHDGNIETSTRRHDMINVTCTSCDIHHPSLLCCYGFLEKSRRSSPTSWGDAFSVISLGRYAMISSCPSFRSYHMYIIMKARPIHANCSEKLYLQAADQRQPRNDVRERMAQRRTVSTQSGHLGYKQITCP